jgi:ribose transport system substrate-binding protein
MKVGIRQQKIIQHLIQYGAASVQELAEMFQLSEVTIRNDLRALEEAGKLIRTHGGATIWTRPQPAARQTRSLGQSGGHDSGRERFEQVQRIAQRAASLVNEGETILLINSAITRAMADELVKVRSLTVLTNSLQIAVALQRNPANTVMLIGGQLRRDGDTLDGAIAANTLETLQVQKAFVSFDGLSLRQGLADDDIVAAQLKAAVPASAQTVVAIGSGDRVGRAALMSFAGCEQIHHLITTEGAPRNILNDLRGVGVQVTVCSPLLTQITVDTVEAGRWRIGFANLNERHEFAVSVRQGIEQAVKDQKNIELIMADNAGDADAALANAQAMLEKRVDLLIEYQQDEHTNYILMDMCRSAGVPVIGIDIPLPGATYFGADNYRSGSIAGEAAVRWTNQHWSGRLDRVVSLEQLESGAVPGSRVQAQIDRLKAAFGLTEADFIHCDTHGDLQNSQLAAIQALRNIPWNKHVLCIGINFNSALGSLAAAETLGRQATTAVIAQNASVRIRRELLTRNRMLIGAVDFFPQHYGAKIIPLAVDILAGRPVPPAVYTDHLLLTPQNVAQVYPGEEGEVGRPLSPGPSPPRGRREQEPHL